MNPKTALESVIRIAAVAFVMYWCFQIFQPFATLLVWSGVIAISLFPFFQRMTKWFKGRKALVAILLNLTFVLGLLIPLIRMGNGLAVQARQFKQSLNEDIWQIPLPDPEVKEWPIVGNTIYSAWENVHADVGKLAQQYSQEITNLATWLLNGLLQMGIDILLTVAAVIISTFLMLHAESAYRFSLLFFQRLTNKQLGLQYCHEARDTIRNVVKGVVLVALIQAVLAGLGFAMIGLSAPGLWALIVFVVAVMQLPASLVTLPLAIYVFSYESTGPAIAFAIYAFLIGFVDNFLKPIFLGRGMSIPMLVILIGSLGGMLWMGILGLFLGPVVFSLGYRLLMNWMQEANEDVGLETIVDKTKPIEGNLEE